MKYKINPEAVIFLDTDALNGYVTVAYDWTTDDLFLIKPHEYQILKMIDDLGVATDDILNNHLGEAVGEEVLKTILEEFVSKKIVYGQD